MASSSVTSSASSGEEYRNRERKISALLRPGNPWGPRREPAWGPRRDHRAL